MSGFTTSTMSNRDDQEKEKLITNEKETEDRLSHIAVNTTHQSVIPEQHSISERKESKKDHTVYPERWYVLGIFSLLSAINAGVCNTWAPIEDTASVVFNLSQAQFSLLPNWSNITYVLTAFFFSWLLRVRGLRISVLLSGVLMVLGTGFPCIPIPTSMMIWTMHLGQIFIGLASPVLTAAPTLLSATWFPANERVTATAISWASNPIGMGASFLLGPLIVSNINETTTTPTIPMQAGNISTLYPADDMHKHLQEIRLLLYIQLGVSALVFLAALIRFPAKPATPPSASAIAEREDTKAGLIAVVKKKTFWIPCLAYCISSSGTSGWRSQMVFILKGKANQTTCGWIGFYNNLAAMLGGLIAGRCADYFTGKMKPILILLTLATCAAFSWVILLVNDFIYFNIASLYTSMILFGLFMSATVPIYFEITVEGSFPVGEETTTFMMLWIFCFINSLFLCLPLIPTPDLTWLTWLVLGSLIVCLPILVLYKEQYNRLKLDACPQDDIEDRRNEDAHV